jgi:hypothetical protein
VDHSPLAAPKVQRDTPQPGGGRGCVSGPTDYARRIASVTRDGRAYRVADSCGPDHPDDGQPWAPTMLETIVALMIVMVVVFIACSGFGL